jgi:hypothetical protein
MSSLTHFLSPDVFAELSEDEIKKLGAAIDHVIVTDPNIRKQIQERIDTMVPHLPSRQKVKKP